MPFLDPSLSLCRRDPRKLLEGALDGNGGPKDWRAWKAREAEKLVELVNESPRVQMQQLSLEGDVHAVFRMDMPVPRWPVGDRLRISGTAVFDLQYEESWRWEPPPSFLPLGLWHPMDVFHPNCRPGPRAMICLGDLPAGTPLKELLLLGYFVVSLQDLVLDPSNPNGVFNPLACEFFRNHQEHLPLTHAGLLDPWKGTNP